MANKTEKKLHVFLHLSVGIKTVKSINYCFLAIMVKAKVMGTPIFLSPFFNLLRQATVSSGRSA